MAKFELNIYGTNDEITKRFKTDHIRFGVLLKALEIQDKAEGKTAAEIFADACEIVKAVFPGVTDEDLTLADSDDVFNTFRQVTRQAGHIKGSDEKN